MTDKVNHAIIISAPTKFLDILFGKSFDENSLHRPDHGLTDLLSLLFQPCLQTLQARLLHCKWRSIGQVDGRRARTRTIDKTVTGIKTHFLNQLHRSFKILIRSHQEIQQ